MPYLGMEPTALVHGMVLLLSELFSQGKFSAFKGLLWLHWLHLDNPENVPILRSKIFITSA